MNQLGKYLILGSTLFFLSTGVRAEGEFKRINFVDGSSIKGRIVSIEDGAYIIETPSLGRIKAQDKNVTSITALSVSPAEKNPSTFQGKDNTSQDLTPTQLKQHVTQLQQDVMANPQMMQEIQSLLQNEEVMSIFSDKQFMNDVMSYDPERIQQNPKLQELIKNPEMKRLMDSLHLQIKGQGSFSQ